MKKFVIIGLGNFGFNLAISLIENGCEVLGIDSSEEIVDRAKDYISHVIIADASKKEILESLMLKDYDGAIVSIGQDMAPSILISLYLKEINVPMIIVRALSEDHGKILNLIGVTDVIFPERDIAVKLANKLSSKNLIDYLPLDDNHGILEIMAPKSFVGKNLKELNITKRFNCQIIGLKKFKDDNPLHLDDKNTEIKIAPSANDIIEENSAMILIGSYDDIEKIEFIK